MAITIFTGTSLIAMESSTNNKQLSVSDKASAQFAQALTARITQVKNMLNKKYDPDYQKNLELSQQLAKLREQELASHHDFMQKLAAHQSYGVYQYETFHEGKRVSVNGYNPQEDESKLTTLARELANYDAKMEAAIITFADVIALHQLAAESMREKLEKSKVTPTATQIRRVVD